MSRRRLCCVLVMLVLVAGAQAPAGPPKPGPEHKRLEYFVGKWNGRGDMKASPFGPAGKMTSSETCKWFAGGFAIVCEGTAKGPMGDIKFMSSIAYNANEKVYVYHAVNSIGEVEHSAGAVKGNIWSWTNQSKMEGKVVRGRFTLTEEPPSAYSYKFEMSVGGAPMAVVMEGKATKAK